MKWLRRKQGDTKPRQSDSLRPRQIIFLSEQDGAVEQNLKTHLRAQFQCGLEIRKAYLARVRYESSNDQKVALCLVDDDVDRPAIVERIGTIFRGIFKTTESMDIVFLSAEQQKQIGSIAKAFYEQLPRET
jgi:type III secretion system (T3SS) SseB-like protein